MKKLTALFCSLLAGSLLFSSCTFNTANTSTSENNIQSSVENSSSVSSSSSVSVTPSDSTTPSETKPEEKPELVPEPTPEPEPIPEPTPEPVPTPTPTEKEIEQSPTWVSPDGTYSLQLKYANSFLGGQQEVEMYYNITPDCYVIMGYSGNPINVVLPTEYNGISITHVGKVFRFANSSEINSVFADCKTLKSITIPEGYEKIGYNTFRGCTALEEVNLPNTLTYIGGACFQDCTSLKEIVIPDSVTELVGRKPYGSWGAPLHEEIFGQFTNCTSLEKITLSKNLTSIGYKLFYGCTALKEIQIPNGVTEIAEGAFYGCTLFKEIHLPDSTTKIGNEAFYNCTLLNKINIPQNVELIIKSNVFTNTAYVKNNTDEQGICYLDGWCIYKEETIKKFTLKVDYKYPDQFFYDNDFIEEVIFEDGITTIPSWFFTNCRNLSKVKLPNTLKIIDNVFDRCTALMKLEVPEGVEVFFDPFGTYREVVLPKSLTDCPYLYVYTVYYHGTQEEWERLSIQLKREGAVVIYNYTD